MRPKRLGQILERTTRNISENSLGSNILAMPGGLEPPTCCLEGRNLQYSIAFKTRFHSGMFPAGSS